jgi:hypothetical protein
VHSRPTWFFYVRVRKMLETDPRIAGALKEYGNWVSLELNDERDLTNTLKWLDLAYRTCLSPNNSKS